MRRATSKPVLVVAHRGASALAPENTAAAVRLAVALGADAVECDVQLSRDGVPIVFHDDDLVRLCGEPSRVAELSAEELVTKRVRVAGTAGRATRIVTLSQWLTLLPRRVLPVVELKRQATAAAERKLAGAAAKVLARRRAPCAVISFSERLVARSRELLPDALVGPVVDRAALARSLAWMRAARPIVALGRSGAGARLVARLVGAGKVVWCWTVDDPDEIVRLVERGVGGIITNRPDVALAALARRRRRR